MSEAALRYRIREDGPWQVLLPGVYLSSTGTVTAVQRETAALLYAGPGSAITGPSALAFHRIRRPQTGMADVLVPAGRRHHDLAYVRVHRTSRMPGLIFPVGEIWYMPPARAVAGTVRGMRDMDEVRAVVADAIQRGRVEANLRTLIKRERLPHPMYNPPLYVGEDFIAVPDAWWPEAGVAVEVDSRQWRLSPRDWERTPERHSRMSAYAIIALHYPPARLKSRPRIVAAEISSGLEAGRGRQRPRLRALPAR
jgi:hypothetical protein